MVDNKPFYILGAAAALLLLFFIFLGSGGNNFDWSENLFSCTYLVNDFKYRMSYSSSNLYDRADKKGSLDIKVIKLDE